MVYLRIKCACTVVTEWNDLIISLNHIWLLSYSAFNSLTIYKQPCYRCACIVHLAVFFNCHAWTRARSMNNLFLNPFTLRLPYWYTVVCICVGIQYISNVLGFLFCSTIRVGSSTTWSGTDICSHPRWFATIYRKTECWSGEFGKWCHSLIPVVFSWEWG